MTGVVDGDMVKQGRFDKWSSGSGCGVGRKAKDGGKTTKGDS